MSSNGEPRGASASARQPTLSERIAVVPADPRIAFVPGRALVLGEKAVDRVKGLAPSAKSTELFPREEDEGSGWFRLEGVDDPLALVELLRAEGLHAQPEHIFFAHGCDPCAAAPPPWTAFESLQPDHLGANPHRANPHRANPHRANDALTNSAVPAAGRAFPPYGLNGPGAHPIITVLDTGLAAGAMRPPLLAGAAGISGDLDRPDAAIEIAGGTIIPADGWLDPVAGHGTFIAGLIEQLAPGCTVLVNHVIRPLGDADEGDVYQAIRTEADRPDITEAAPAGTPRRPHILSMSFGGRILDSAPALRDAVAKARQAGIVVVASAGNDGSPLPQYPAALHGVIAVGALGPDGPASWTNYGNWVDACAPGVDLVSAFFAAFDGPAPRINTLDPDNFASWATWSGTSFSAPVVVAALAREMVLGTCTATDAVNRIVHAPHLLRIPCLGTVVNI